MLDERDLQAVREIATEVTTDVVVKLVPDIVAKVTTDIIDKRVPKIIDERVPKIIDERVPGIVTTIANDIVKNAIHDSEVMLLDEMERYDRKNERKFAEIQKDLSELKELYRMIKNEQDTITILIRNLEDHEMRISRLEEQSTQKNEKIRRIKS